MSRGYRPYLPGFSLRPPPMPRYAHIRQTSETWRYTVQNRRGGRCRWQWRSCRIRARHSGCNYRRITLSARSNLFKMSRFARRQIATIAQQFRLGTAVSVFCDALRVARYGRISLQVVNKYTRGGLPCLRQSAAHPAGKLRGQLRINLLISGKLFPATAAARFLAFTRPSHAR